LRPGTKLTMTFACAISLCSASCERTSSVIHAGGTFGCGDLDRDRPVLVGWDGVDVVLAVDVFLIVAVRQRDLREIDREAVHGGDLHVQLAARTFEEVSVPAAGGNGAPRREQQRPERLRGE
jgi:hypothetical protein